MANTWYFHPGVGTDSPSNGSIGSPCNTLAYTVNTIASSGDTVLGYGGSTSTENAVLTTPVTIGSYGTGQVTIAGGAGAAISVTNADGYTINNIAATGATATYVSGNAVGVIQFLNTTTSTVYSNGTTITNCTITGAWQCGILMIANSTTGANGYRNITIAGNNVSGGLFIGIFLQGDTSGTYEGQHFSNVTIGTSSSPNVVHGVNGTSGAQINQKSGHGIVVSGHNTGTGPVLLQYNLVYSCGSSAIAGGSDAIWCFFGTNAILQNNVVHDMSTNGAVADGCGIDIDVGSVGCMGPI